MSSLLCVRSERTRQGFSVSHGVGKFTILVMPLGLLIVPVEVSNLYVAAVLRVKWGSHRHFFGNFWSQYPLVESYANFL